VKQLKVGIAGLRRGVGYLRHFDRYRYADVRVTAVYDPRPGPMAEMQKEHGAEPCGSFAELISADVDAVVVASPPAFHAEQTVAAASAGKHVLCEVPAALTLEECGAVVDAVRSSGVKYMMSENGNFEGFVRTWRKLVRDGRLGTVLYAEGEYIHDLRDEMLADSDGNWIRYADRHSVADAQPTWRATFPPSLYMPHPLGPLLYMLGNDRCVTVSALSTGSELASDLRDTPDMQAAILKTAGGAVLRCTLAYAVEREPPLTNWQSLYGTEGTVEWKRCEWDKPKAWFRHMRGWLEGAGRPDMAGVPWSTLNPETPPEARGWDDWGNPHPSSRYDCDWYVVHEFLQAILQDSRPPIDAVPGDGLLGSRHLRQHLRAAGRRRRANSRPAGGRWLARASRRSTPASTSYARNRSPDRWTTLRRSSPPTVALVAAANASSAPSAAMRRSHPC
jgi:predicted dehydrogenase